ECRSRGSGTDADRGGAVVEFPSRLLRETQVQHRALAHHRVEDKAKLDPWITSWVSERGIVFAHHQPIEGVEGGALVREKSERGLVAIEAVVTGSASVEDASEEVSAVIDADQRRLGIVSGASLQHDKNSSATKPVRLERDQRACGMNRQDVAPGGVTARGFWFMRGHRCAFSSCPAIGKRRGRPRRGALEFQAAAFSASSSRSRLQSAALSMLISVRAPTLITRGPHPSRCILKYMSSLMLCRTQNAWIDIASACGSTLFGFRLYFGLSPVASGGPRIGGVGVVSV